MPHLYCWLHLLAGIYPWTFGLANAGDRALTKALKVYLFMRRFNVKFQGQKLKQVLVQLTRTTLIIFWGKIKELVARFEGEG